MTFVGLTDLSVEIKMSFSIWFSADASQTVTVENIFSLVGKLGSEEIQEIIESIEFQDTGKILNVIREAYAKGLQPTDISNSISEFFRNLFYLKYLPDDKKLCSVISHVDSLSHQLNKVIFYHTDCSKLKIN